MRAGTLLFMSVLALLAAAPGCRGCGGEAGVVDAGAPSTVDAGAESADAPVEAAGPGASEAAPFAPGADAGQAFGERYAPPAEGATPIKPGARLPLMPLPPVSDEEIATDEKLNANPNLNHAQKKTLKVLQKLSKEDRRFNPDLNPYRGTEAIPDKGNPAGDDAPPKKAP